MNVQLNKATEADELGLVKEGVQSLRNLQNASSEREDQDKFAILKLEYLEELSEAWRELAQSANLAQQESVGKQTEAIHIAHKIRGSAGSVGFHQIGELAGEIEDLLELLDPPGELDELIWTQICNALARGAVLVQELNSAYQVPSPRVIDAGSKAYALT